MLGCIEVVAVLHVTANDPSVHSLRRLRCLTTYCSTLRRLKTHLASDLKPFVAASRCSDSLVELDVSPPTDNIACGDDRSNAPLTSSNALTTLPLDISLPRLRYFKGNGAVTLKNIEGLRAANAPLLSRLFISGTAVSSLPANLSKELQFVDVSRCERIKSLQPLLSAHNLSKLDISFTTAIEAVPSLPMLDTLNAQKSMLKRLDLQPQLKRLNITHCTRLRALPKLPQVEIVHAAFASNLCDIKSLHNSTTLVDLNIANNSEIFSLPRLPSLERLVATRASGLVDWPTISVSVATLEELQLGYCDGLQLTALPPGLFRIKILNVSGMQILRDISSLENSPTLEMLDVTQCDALQPKLPMLPNLRTLIAPSSGLKDIGSLAHSPHLTELNIACTSRIVSLPKMPSLRILCAYDSQLVDVSALQGTSIQEVILPAKAATFLSKLPKYKFKQLTKAVGPEGTPIGWK